MSVKEDQSERKSTPFLVKVAKKRDESSDEPIFFIKQDGAVYCFIINSSICQTKLYFTLRCSGKVLTEIEILFFLESGKN